MQEIPENAQSYGETIHFPEAIYQYVTRRGFTHRHKVGSYSRWISINLLLIKEKR